MTVGSRSTKTALGTCLPAPVSLKKVLKESSPPPMVLSLGIWPSGWIPCSRQYNSQHALPIWAPAWPTCMEIHSRCRKRGKKRKEKDMVSKSNLENAWKKKIFVIGMHDIWFLPISDIFQLILANSRYISYCLETTPSLSCAEIIS